jgi:hypothetical protein
MVRLDQMAEPMRSHLAQLSCPTFKTHPLIRKARINREYYTASSNEADWI